MHHNSIAALILTYNEEKHITRCINSLKDVCEEIFVIDSFSKDKTVEISKILGAKVYQHPFENQARQFNWAIKNCPITSDWIWRVDADEYIEPALAEKVVISLPHVSLDVNGIYVNKKIVFMGRSLLHGGWYPAQQIKIIRKGYGTSEDKWMDEHLIIFSGTTISIDGDQTDENLNDLSWWTQKHNNYSNREAVNMLLMEYGMNNQGEEVASKLFGTDAERKRWLKMKYVRAPLFLRPFINFFIRYILKAGFLDGKQGFIWHFLQGFWYRFLVDAKIYEIKKQFDFDDERIKQYLIENYLTK
ncbi:glycosyltransferase family 2 [Bacteroides clarus CAG:160]|uniref:glycosyltransferase family 2 protein n=1 Tax=Bacteroides TaxID=816 RepID=UPI000334B9C8|nr:MULTISPECIES: glycosyltransferase family 2 protein [Bacteroides]CDB82924.1 glycosyltransferase family 2 [Bacteroides clarus CAG:160]